MERVSEVVGRPVSLHRIDSIVWQAGQIIGKYESDCAAARDALTDHFEKVGIGSEPAKVLAEELTAEM
jgi:hypothetical protein